MIDKLSDIISLSSTTHITDLHVLTLKKIVIEFTCFNARGSEGPPLPIFTLQLSKVLSFKIEIDQLEQNVENISILQESEFLRSMHEISP